MKIIKENILNSTEKYIAQQCNCLTVSAHGLSQSLADKWTWCHPYSSRSRLGRRNLAIEDDRDESGTIRILSSENKDKNVICMFAQWAPSKPGKYNYPNSDTDTYQNREKWFEECLDKILEIDDLESIAFPYQIGCGLAKGSWSIIANIIQRTVTNAIIVNNGR